MRWCRWVSAPPCPFFVLPLCLCLQAAARVLLAALRVEWEEGGKVGRQAMRRTGRCLGLRGWLLGLAAGCSSLS